MTSFIESWNALPIAPENHPMRAGKIYLIEYEALREKVESNDLRFASSMTKSLYEGDFYLVKNVFSKQFMTDVKDRVYKSWKNSESSFHKMLEGVPDFHRVIDEVIGKKYYANPLKHTSYFFHWNRDPLEFFPEFYKRWRIFKVIAGLQANQYETNTPKDGIVDRIQVVNYPRGGGKIDVHSDPYLSQKIVTSVYMSKRGEEYETGGCFVINRADELVDLEELIDIGDMGFSFPTIAHGVAPVDPHRPIDWSARDGRWWVGMFSNFSDEVKDRHTGAAYDLPASNQFKKIDGRGLEMIPNFI